MREAERSRGDDPDELPHRYATFIKRVVARKPADMVQSIRRESGTRLTASQSSSDAASNCASRALSASICSSRAASAACTSCASKRCGMVRRRLCHAPRAARRAKAAPLATEGDEFVVTAVAAAQSQETVREDAALQERVELVLHELRQVGSGGRLCFGDEGRRVLLHQAVQRGLLRSVTLVVDRGAIQRPLGLPAKGLLARLPRL
jgi:hypothetical protein